MEFWDSGIRKGWEVGVVVVDMCVCVCVLWCGEWSESGIHMCRLGRLDL